MCIRDRLAYYADDKWTEEQLSLIINFSRQAIQDIRDHGDFPKDEVSSWDLGYGWTIHARGYDPVPHEPIALFGEAFILLLQNNLPVPPEKTTWFYGTKNEPMTIEINCNYDEIRRKS